AGFERQRLTGADGFFAEALHVEGDLLLTLGDEHARIENAGLDHDLHALAQNLWVNGRLGPWPDGVAVVVEHADQRERKIGVFAIADVEIGLADFARSRQWKIGKISGMPRTPGRFGHVQPQWRGLSHDASENLVEFRIACSVLALRPASFGSSGYHRR